MNNDMSDDTTKDVPVGTPASEFVNDAREPNAVISGASALPQAELNRMTDDIIAGIKTVFDPEIPADVYELGLIYRISAMTER
jgi:hypothetical protein